MNSCSTVSSPPSPPGPTTHARPTVSSRFRSAVSRLLSALSCLSLLNHAPEDSHHPHRSAISQLMIQDENSSSHEGYPLAHSAILAAGPISTNSHIGPKTHSRTHSVVNSQPRTPPNRVPGGSRDNSSHLTTSQAATRDRNSPNNEDCPANGAFSNAHHVVLNHPVFVEGVHPKEKDCIDLLAHNIIPGAQFDSGERYPPPSCHPGTRLDISEKLVSWMRDLMRKHKIVWLHGPAGVGKSAVIQTLAEAEANSETSILGATLFFSKPNERDDPQRVFITVAYQLAVKYPTYRAYVVERLVVDPLLVRKSLVEQFKWLIVKPFAEKKLLEGIHDTVLATLDGLDECNGESAQREIIFLISKFCLEHPTTPLIWIIASRPEPGICTAFSHRNVGGAYMEIEMPVDADQACRDVECYLRDTFAEIKEQYSMSFSSTQLWPTETDFTKITNRSSGLFAFANTIARFTGDAEYANPVAQLRKVLDVLESPSSLAVGDSPFAALDMLYTLILSAIPPKVWPVTWKLLVIKQKCFLAEACNFLFVEQADAYSALQKLHSVLRIPSPKSAPTSSIRVFHKSFDDYLESPSRSGSFWLGPLEADGVLLSASIQILLGAYDATKSIIHPSNVNIPWPDDGGNMEKQKKKSFFRSLDSVLRAPLNRTRSFDELRYFFQDIDYAGPEFVHPSDGVASLINCLLTSHLMPQFKEWGVITTVPIQSLDFDSITLENPRSVLTNKGNPKSDLKRIRKRITKRSRAADAVDWYEQRVCFDSGDRTYWRDQIRRHLTGLPSSHPVTVLGKGNKSLVIISVDDLEESWIYMLPYRPS